MDKYLESSESLMAAKNYLDVANNLPDVELPPLGNQSD